MLFPSNNHQVKEELRDYKNSKIQKSPDARNVPLHIVQFPNSTTHSHQRANSKGSQPPLLARITQSPSPLATRESCWFLKSCESTASGLPGIGSRCCICLSGSQVHSAKAPQPSPAQAPGAVALRLCKVRPTKGDLQGADCSDLPWGKRHWAREGQQGPLAQCVWKRQREE